MRVHQEAAGVRHGGQGAPPTSGPALPQYQAEAQGSQAKIVDLRPQLITQPA